MKNPDQPFQFSLRTAFALMLWAAGTLAYYRYAGLLSAAPSIVVVYHLIVMLRLGSLPLPWSETRLELNGVGWSMTAPFVPFALLKALMALIQWDVIPADYPLTRLAATFLLGSTYFLTPIAFLCALRAGKIMDEALRDEPALLSAFGVTRVAMPIGMLVFFCGNCSSI